MEIFFSLHCTHKTQKCYETALSPCKSAVNVHKCCTMSYAALQRKRKVLKISEAFMGRNNYAYNFFRDKIVCWSRAQTRDVLHIQTGGRRRVHLPVYLRLPLKGEQMKINHGDGITMRQNLRSRICLRSDAIFLFGGFAIIIKLMAMLN